MKTDTFWRCHMNYFLKLKVTEYGPHGCPQLVGLTTLNTIHIHIHPRLFLRHSNQKPSGAVVGAAVGIDGGNALPATKSRKSELEQGAEPVNVPVMVANTV
jgi:hypothetical protein